MGISGNALAFIGGAAEQFAENKQGFKKNYVTINVNRKNG